MAAILPVSSASMPKPWEVTKRNQICRTAVAALGLVAVVFASLASFRSQATSLWVAAVSVAVIASLLYIPIHHIDWPDATGKTGLHWASIKGQRAWLKVLLFFGANPNKLDNEWHTPLSYAAKTDRGLVLRVLIGAGGNVQTALYSLVEYLHPRGVEMLLNHRADPKGSYNDIIGNPLNQAQQLAIDVESEGYSRGGGRTKDQLKADVVEVMDLLKEAIPKN